MLKSSGAMAGATLVSRLLGMVREIVYARFMGDGWVAGAFQFAFTIPNLFRRLLGEGALTAAFIPIFKEKEKTHGEIEMWRAANAVISGLIVAASVVVALVMIGLSLVLAAHQFDASTELMLRLLLVMFPYMLLVCLAAAMMGMLNARGHFFIPAMGATMLNVVMIASVLWLAPTMGLDFPKEERLPHQIFALAIGVLAAGVAQAAFQLPTLWQDGFRYRWVSPWRDETVRRVVCKMIPGTIGVAAFQINVTLVLAIAFWVNTQIVASFNYAVRLMELPQGMFGISLATYLLPTLSSLAAEKNYSEFRGTLRHGLGTTLTRRPATYNGIWIGARSCPRDCAHEQSSMNPIMADANSIAENQQKPSDRPKYHPPRETVLQVIGDLFQPFALSRRAGLDASPFRCRTFHQSLHPACDCLRVGKLHLDLFRSLPGCLNVNFDSFFQLLVLAVHRVGKIICHRLTLPPVFSQM